MNDVFTLVAGPVVKFVKPETPEDIQNERLAGLLGMSFAHMVEVMGHRYSVRSFTSRVVEGVEYNLATGQQSPFFALT